MRRRVSSRCGYLRLRTLSTRPQVVLSLLPLLASPLFPPLRSCFGQGGCEHSRRRCSYASSCAPSLPFSAVLICKNVYAPSGCPHAPAPTCISAFSTASKLLLERAKMLVRLACVRRYGEELSTLSFLRAAKNLVDNASKGLKIKNFHHNIILRRQLNSYLPPSFCKKRQKTAIFYAFFLPSPRVYLKRLDRRVRLRSVLR